MRVLLDTHTYLWADELSPRLSEKAKDLIGDRSVHKLLSVATILPITADQALEVRRLPQIHSDPCDRLSIAVARTEGVPILGGNARFDAYDVQRLW